MADPYAWWIDANMTVFLLMVDVGPIVFAYIRILWLIDDQGFGFKSPYLGYLSQKPQWAVNTNRLLVIWTG